MTQPTNLSELKTGDFLPKVIGLVLFVGLFGLGGVWLGTTNLASAVIVPGSVGIVDEVKSVQHRDGGLVQTLRVKAGQSVSKGDLLIELDVTEQRIRAKALMSRIRDLNARMIRLNAERRKISQIDWNFAGQKSLQFLPSRSQMEREAELLQVRASSRSGNVQKAENEIRKLLNQSMGLSSQIESKQRERRMLEQELTSLKQLLEKGFATPSDIRNAEKQAINSDVQINELITEKAILEHAIQDQKIKVKQDDVAFREALLLEISAVEAQLKELMQQFLADQKLIERAKILSPASGMVHKLSVFTEGGVITASQELMQIVPASSDLEIEAKIETRHVDDVDVGMPTKVRLSGFDMRTTPDVLGLVRSISPDAIIDQASGLPHYLVRVKVSSDELAKLNVSQIVPGMPVEVFVSTGERTAFTYLVDPFLKHFSKAFIE